MWLDGPIIAGASSRGASVFSSTLGLGCLLVFALADIGSPLRRLRLFMRNEGIVHCQWRCARKCSAGALALQEVLDRDVLRVPVREGAPDRYRQRIARELHHCQSDGFPDAVVDRDEGGGAHSQLEGP